MKYVEPEMEIVEVEQDDVIITSMGDGDSTVDGNGLPIKGGNSGQKW